MKNTSTLSPAPVVLRVMRHPLDLEREAWLRDFFGEHMIVITEDVPYGDDPVASVQAVIDMIEAAEDRQVVGVEAGGPEPKVIALVEALATQGIPLIRQVFQRGPDGRVIVTGQDEKGRDILAFDSYEAVEVEVRKALIQRPLIAQTSAKLSEVCG